MTGPNHLSIADAGVVHVVGRAATSRHANPVAKILVPWDGVLDLDSSGRRAEVRSAVIVPAGVIHQVRSSGVVAAVLLDPAQSRALAGDTWRAASPRLAAALRAVLAEPVRAPDIAPDELIAEVATIVGATDRPIDRRVRRAAVLLGDASVADVAAEVGLSRYHLARLFQADLGMSPRRYALYRRVLAGVRLVLSGAPVGEAAFAAGFADHAHFTRASQRLAGQAPSFFAARSFKRR